MFGGLFVFFGNSSPTVLTKTKSILEFKMKDIDGKDVKLKKYKGDVLLIVNTASKCGYTPQYEGLQAIYEKYQSQGFYVLGFPANNFGGQEPGKESEIKEFCE
ncbi:MAG: redoxin domain-containing protein, partial [Acidobacteriota bacterium]|nr:redoxin domain-containing protein [Acidobacteriota bacterium]